MTRLSDLNLYRVGPWHDLRMGDLTILDDDLPAYFEASHLAPTTKQHLKSGIMIIRPTSGLCNRLRVIFSRFSRGDKMEVVWQSDEKCNGHFLDVFEPIDGLEFVTKPIGKVKYSGPYPNGDADYSMLRPIAAVRDEVETIAKKLNGAFTAVHVRRTDGTKLAKKKSKFTGDEDFYRFIEQTDDPVFVSCDEEATLVRFKERYPNRIKVVRPFPTPNQLRHTTLHHAVVDIFTCVVASRFMGSGYSSFSDLIEELRKPQR